MVDKVSENHYNIAVSHAEWPLNAPKAYLEGGIINV
jgi:hypothetical protein